MLGRVPSFARCFFHFQRNSGFMKILYSLLKYVCVCVCVCVHMRSAYLADRTCLKQLDLTRSFLQFVIPTLSTHEKQLSNVIHICIWGEQGLSGKVNPLGKQALLWRGHWGLPLSSFFLPLPSQVFWESLIHRNEIYCLSRRQSSKSIVFLCQAFEKHWEAGKLALYSLLSTSSTYNAVILGYQVRAEQVYKSLFIFSYEI